MVFEVRYTDLAGRIGKLVTPHGVVETPAFVPVVHPVKQTVSTQLLKKMGFDIVITNAYITLRHYGDTARKHGIHSIINYDGVIMTDSGGYQVLEYGSVEVEPETIAQFEVDIKSDILVPLDKPTGYGLDYERAKEYVAITLKNAEQTLKLVGGGCARREAEGSSNGGSSTGAIWVGPVQGAEHSDLVEHSARELDRMGFQLMALGSPVELMEAYEFATLARMIITAKQVIPAKPIHLFGAGHPLTIPLAIALGCDTFDSASYMLYARDGRYMLPTGTVKLDKLSYLACQCQVCTSYTVQELRQLDAFKRTLEVAKHNLHVLKGEVDAVKQAIMDGRLWEYVVQKARAHPRLMETTQLFKDLRMLEDGTPLFKEKALFFCEPIDQYRPEAKRFRRMVSEFKPSRKKKLLVVHPEGEVHPFYSAKSFRKIVSKFPDAQICSYNPFLGIIPAEISDIFPASHSVSTRLGHKPEDYPTFVESLNKFVTGNCFEQVVVMAADDAFMKDAIVLAKLNNVQVVDGYHHHHCRGSEEASCL